MKLSYRGVEYDHNPPILEVTESEIQCTYRGRSLHYTYVHHIPVRQREADLVYRGTPYHCGPNGQTTSMAQAAREPIFTTLQTKINTFNPMNPTRRQLLQEAAQAHQESIKRSLSHRIEVARNQGNFGLLKQLEDEMRQIA